MLRRLDDEKPVFLVVAEKGLSLPGLTVEFLKNNNLEVEQIDLDQDFLLKCEELINKKIRIHKIVFIHGFFSSSAVVYEEIFRFFDVLNKSQTEKIPISLISPTCTSLEIVEDSYPDYLSHLRQQMVFLENFFSRFDDSLVFLAQDLLIAGNKLDYPLLLFFSAIEQNSLLDLQAKFYFQDELSFFNLIKEHLIRPHHRARFLIRGLANPSLKIIKNISYLYEQYFQKKLLLVKLFSNEKPGDFLKEFSLVANSKSQIEDLIDQKIRNISSSRTEISQAALSEIELEKMIEIARLKKAKQLTPSTPTKRETPINRLENVETSKSSSLWSLAHKGQAEGLLKEDFGSEFALKIEKLFSTQRKGEKEVRQQKNIVWGNTIIKKSKKRKILFFLGTFSFSAALLFIGLFSLFNSSKKLLRLQLYNSLKNEGATIEKIDKSVFFRLFDFQLNQYLKIFSEETLSEALDTRRLSGALTGLSASKAESDEIAYDLYRKTLEGGVELGQVYENFIVATDKKIEALKVFNSYLMSLNLDLYHGEEKLTWESKLEENKLALKSELENKRFFSSFKNLILGGGRINLLVLNQDSNEIRSTGGLLKEIMILSFEKANLVDRQILNVEDLDSRAYGQKDSPYEIEVLLGEKRLRLRDSNWQTDFPKTSQEIKWFVEQSTGSRIDLVLALNSKIMARMLAIVDDQSAGKQLSLTALFEKLSKLDRVQFISLSSVFSESLNQRELLLQASSQELAQAIEANSWAGKKVVPPCPVEFKQEGCLTDSLFQIENNVGLNKVNSYVKETIEHNIGISKDFIRHKRRITFENSIQAANAFLGTYRNYLKFYLNSQASLEKVEIDGKKIDDQLVTIGDADGSKELSVLLEVPSQSKVELAITYLVPNLMEVPFSYVFFDQKQPGIFDKKINYNIVFEEQFKPQLIAPMATYQDRTIHFENNNSDHFLFAIGFND